MTSNWVNQWRMCFVHHKGDGEENGSDIKRKKLHSLRPPVMAEIKKII